MTLLNETTDETRDELTGAEVAALPAADGAGDNNNGNGGKRNGAVESPMPGNVRASDIVGEMQTAYLDYAMSVIVSRALPDVRDGLKPVHRRILYAMSHDLYLYHTKPHRKSARIVGEVLGKYHPHGDVAVYDAMVRMAQEFSLRYPLIDGQGNFGSVDGDGAAAMRYTEARLAEISELMLADLDKDTVTWHDNFDSSLEEPDILPAALPNLLINGSSGIAVGMATNIPPHNLGEIVDALVYLIDRYTAVEEITVEELLHFVKGPDFPTGGILYRFREDKTDENTDVIAQGYAMGKARMIMQAKAHFEEMSRGRSRIVVTELPYQTNKTALIERIASLVRDGKIEGITDLRDESDRTGMRIVVELTRNADPKKILTDLFKYTPLQQTFGMQMLALVDGQPRLLSLKRALHLFVQHREEIIRRRSAYDLAKARDRAHIVEGLLKALDILDEVIATIRRSQTVETARNNLVKNFKFTEIQAQAILDMQLRRLAALERKKLKEEYDALMERIAYLEDLLAHPEKILAVIRKDLLAQKEKYGDARRTQIVDRTKGTLTSTDLLPQQEVWVTVSAEGDLRRQDVTKLDSATLGKMAKVGQVAMLTANTRDWLYLFCRDGRCTRIAIHEIPQNGSPKHVSELSDFTRRDAITAALSVPRIGAGEADGYLFLATALGNVKRVTLADFVSNVAAEFVAITVEVKDRLQWVLPTPGEQEVMLFTATGQSIRFGEEDVRSMGLAAGGVGGIKLKKGDLVIHADVIDPARDGTVLTMTAQGYAKRSALSDYSRQGRNGSGIVTHKPNNRTGLLTAAMVLDATVGEEELIAIVTAKKKVDALPISAIPVMGRGVQGKPVVTLGTNDTVAALKRVTESSSFTPTDRPSDPAPDAGDGAAGNLPPTATTGGSARSNGTATADAGEQAPNGRVRGKAKRGATAGKSTQKTGRQVDATAPVATGQAEVESKTAKPQRETRGTAGTTAQAGESGRAARGTSNATTSKTTAPKATASQTTSPTSRTKAATQAKPQVKSEATKQDAAAKSSRTRSASADSDNATHRQQPAATEATDATTEAKAPKKSESTKSGSSRAKGAGKQPATAENVTGNGTHRQPKATDNAATTAGTKTGSRRATKQAERANVDSTPSAKTKLDSRTQAAGAKRPSNATANQADSPKAKRTKSAGKTAADPQARSTKETAATRGSAQADTMKSSKQQKSVDKLNRVTTNPQKVTAKKTKKSAAETADAKPQTLELFPLETVDAERKPAKTSGKSQPTTEKKARKLDAAVSMPNAKKKPKSRSDTLA